MAGRDPVRGNVTISFPLDSDKDKIAKVLAGMDRAGATLEQVGFLMGMLAQGKCIDENGDEREFVKVDARTQALALRLLVEVRGLITKKIEQKNEKVAKIRMERAELGSGELAGITGRMMRMLSPAARDEVLRVTAKVVETHDDSQ